MQERIISQEVEPIIDDENKNLKIIENNPVPNIKTYESPNLSLVTRSTLEIVEEITKTELIDSKDASNIVKAQTFLLGSYKDVPIYNTRIAKVSSILSDGKFGTNDAKYWQCKMQAEVHFNEFIRGIYKLDRVKIDLEEIQYQIATLDNILNDSKVLEESKMDAHKLGFDRRRLVNKLNQYMYEMKLLEKDIKQRLREINDWVEIGKEYENGCLHSVTEYDEHTYKNHYMHLKSLVDGAKSTEERSQYLDQLNTFLRLVGKPAIK